MDKSELSERNYKRISIVNWLLCVPFVILFAWPYLIICRFLHIELIVAYTGALLFSAPFTITILHGHVTMALGSLHRHHYYDWLVHKPLTYGLLFHPIFMRTRFRLVLIVLSVILLGAGYALVF